MVKKTIPRPILHVFREIETISTTTRYELVETSGGDSLLTDHLSISVNRGLTKDTSERYLSPTPNGDWPQLTYIKETFLDTLFIGHRADNRDTLLVHINEGNCIAEVYYFQDFYTKKIGPLLQAIEQNKVKS